MIEQSLFLILFVKKDQFLQKKHSLCLERFAQHLSERLLKSLLISLAHRWPLYGVSDTNFCVFGLRLLTSLVPFFFPQ